LRNPAFALGFAQCECIMHLCSGNQGPTTLTRADAERRATGALPAKSDRLRAAQKVLKSQSHNLGDVACSRGPRLVATAAPGVGPRKRMLVPPRIKWCDPVGLGTVDASGICRCDDGCDYVVKDGSKNSATPHDEWFCTRLAENVGIPSPPCLVIERQDGSLVFGSRWEGGVASDPWWEMVKRDEIVLSDIRSALSRIYAFDHFIHNEDRHLNNFLFRRQRQGWAVLAFDYSRAWLANGMPLPALPFPPNKKTMMARRFLVHEFGEYIDKDEACGTLQKIANVKETHVLQSIDGHPKSWLSDSEKDKIIGWWRSQARIDRIDQIHQGIHDGTFL
jgi:hypothetical protein